MWIEIAVIGVLIVSFILRKIQYSSRNIKDDVPTDERIYHFMACYEFPWECFYGINFAFYRTFSSPTISGLYYKTGTIEKTTEKRVNDTDILMHAWVDYGVDSKVGSESWKHLNKIHSSFAGKHFNRDFVYVLCCFIADTIRFIEVFGYRKLTQEEQEGLFKFWIKVGDRMNLTDMPKTLKESIKLVDDYVDSDAYSYSTDGGKALVEAITSLLSRWYWFVPRPLIYEGATALLHVIGGKTFVKKLGLAPAKSWMLNLVYAGAYARKIVMVFFPPRYQPHRLSKQLMSQLYNPHALAMNFKVVGPETVIKNF